jgi:hypothetical protein
MDEAKYSLLRGVWTNDKQPYDLEQQVLLYTITGFSADDNCLIVYAGKGDDDSDRWFLVWFRSGERVETPDNAFGSPEDARKAAVAIYQSAFKE